LWKADPHAHPGSEVLPKHETADDAALVAAVRGGDGEALGELFRRHGQAVHSTAYRVTGSPQDAEDVLQDVFLMLPDALQRYEERQQFASWLKRVATLTALMRVRSRAARRETAADPLWELPSGESSTVVERVAVQKALGSVPEAMRVVWLLKEVEGYSHAEIAEMLGISSGNSAARLFRAWKLLRAALG
jgi:RNA polymerase sigma-70 factor (ECF subfamily)